MSLELDERLRASGTRFKLYPQSPVMEVFAEPETVWVSPPAGSLEPGPADQRMYVVDAIGKRPYEGLGGLPYRGPRHAPVQP